LDRVPMRESGMIAYEIMLSESQERMLMVLKPGREEMARAIFDKWELDFAVIGRLTDSGRLVLTMNGAVACDIPLAPLVELAPVYARPYELPSPRPELAAASVPAPADLRIALKQLLGSPDLASRRWIWEQYDSTVMADTVIRPGGDAGLVRVHGTRKALALTTDCTPRYCAADPVEGGRQAVAEAYRNITATGATPLAVTDNLNFGNPERREVMGQFAGCIEGMAAACTALDFPVVSGNVSFYNETSGESILPTPVIGGVGLMRDHWNAVRIAFPAAGQAVVLIGGTAGWLGASIYLREILGREEGAPPPVDLAAERRNGDFVRTMIGAGLVTACHDLSDGGLYVALAEMAMAGRMGCSIAPPGGIPPLHAWLFGEDQARYLVVTGEPERLLAAAAAAGVEAALLGRTGGAELTVAGAGPISVAELSDAHESWFPAYMAGSEARPDEEA
ncbi:MAG: AIR synthase-related protein, partial [Alphaproteobacteria bacterium]